MQIWAESGKSALPICNYSQILYQFLTFTQNLKRSPFITVGIFLIRALSRYVKSGNVRKEKSSIKKSLGEVLKQHREECKMTQEFVAESIGVSRQAVSKWETGVSKTKRY